MLDHVHSQALGGRRLLEGRAALDIDGFVISTFGSRAELGSALRANDLDAGLCSE